MSFENNEPSGYEDAILPDDFSEDMDDQSESLESQEQADNQENPENPDQPQSQEGLTEEEKIRIKFNHEEMELPMSQAQELVQKGMNYDKVFERLSTIESDPRLSFVQELAESNEMSVEDFIESFQYERHQAQLEQLIQNNIPEELAEEILASREDRAQRAREQEVAAQQQEEQQQYLGFFEEFKNLNGREYDAQKDFIPNEVWAAHHEGMPLRFAYMQHFNKELQNKLRVLQQNKTNEQRSPITSTTSHGSHDVFNEDEFMKGFNSI